MKKINCLYVERKDNQIHIYGAHTQHGVREVEVLRSTMDMPNIGINLFGSKYTLEYLRKKLADHPTHNYVFAISDDVVTWPAPDDIFVDSTAA